MLTGAKTPPAVLCDFDDTTAVENVAQLLLEHFGENATRQELRRQAHENTISFKQYQECAFRSINASKEAMQAVVKAETNLRPYFKELWRYCQAREIPMAIVTVGLDFYVDALLEREGLEDVPRYAVKTTFTPGGIDYGYTYPWNGSPDPSRGLCLQWGNCKCRVLEEYREKGHMIIYVGDGSSDFCPASIADMVFARGQLTQLCEESGVAYTELKDFQGVILGLESWADQHRQENT